MKTVKDLKKDAEGKHYYGYIVDFINNELEAAAHEWIDELKDNALEKHILHHSTAEEERLIEWIEYFFDIEDD